MTTLSVVIPAYNEEDSIQAVMARVLAIRARARRAGPRSGADRRG